MKKLLVYTLTLSLIFTSTLSTAKYLSIGNIDLGKVLKTIDLRLKQFKKKESHLNLFSKLCFDSEQLLKHRITGCHQSATALAEEHGVETVRSIKFRSTIISLSENFHSQDPQIITMIGFAAKHLKMYDMAERYLLEATRLNSHPIYRNNLGTLYKVTGENDLAFDIFKKGCLEYREKYSCYNLALLTENTKRALFYLKQSLKLGYNHWSWLEKNKDARVLRNLKGFNGLINKYKILDLAKYRSKLNI